MLYQIIYSLHIALVTPRKRPCLEHSYWISGLVVAWIRSYLTNRTQRIAIGFAFSDDMKLKFGVPQGPVLGPRLYCLFSKPNGEICRYDMDNHCYADDTQVYLVIEPDIAFCIKSCLANISDCMRTNLLKLKQTKLS